jgi:hypothetical protein
MALRVRRSMMMLMVRRSWETHSLLCLAETNRWGEPAGASAAFGWHASEAEFASKISINSV